MGAEGGGKSHKPRTMKCGETQAAGDHAGTFLKAEERTIVKVDIEFLASTYSAV